jgi:threonine dehydratase
MPKQVSRLNIHRIEAARERIDPVFLHTPQLVAEHLGALLGVRLILKIETLNPVRSFKGRGADLLVSGLANNAPAICASAGNFGQAVAWSCRKRNIPLIIYAGTKANAFKIERMRALGAEVILYGDDFDAAKLEAKRVAAEKGYRFIEDGADIETLEGAGTIALELLDFNEKPDVLLVPLGNGTLQNCAARVCRLWRCKVRVPRP